MLINKLYTLVSVDSLPGESVSATIMLNRDHSIFEGHFPGNPILPGVCTVEIVKEILEIEVKKKLMLTKAANIKYLGFISPLDTPEVNFQLTIKDMVNEGLTCTASVIANGNVVCSFKGEYSKQ